MNRVLVLIALLFALPAFGETEATYLCSQQPIYIVDEIHSHTPLIIQAPEIEIHGSVIVPNNPLQIITERCTINGKLHAESGSIEIKGRTVHLLEHALLEVSANSTPGAIVIEDAQEISVEEGARLLANAKTDGDGGTITLSCRERASFQGVAEVRGGSESGNGGKIHFSTSGSLFQLSEKPFIDAQAPMGKSGELLFDPKFVTITPSGSDPAVGNTFSSNPTGSVEISGASLQAALNGADVVIQANTDIAFQDTVSTSSSHSLTLQAGRSILFSGSLTLNGGDFTATINDSGAAALDRDPGEGQFLMDDSSQILTQGGAIEMDVGTFGGLQAGTFLMQDTALLDAGGGSINLSGFATDSTEDSSYGITLRSFAQISTSGAGAVSLSGEGGNGANYTVGIYLDSSSRIEIENGPLLLTGTGGGNGHGIGNIGVYAKGTINSLGTGSIALQGTGGLGLHGNMGVCLSGGQINAVDGTTTLTGTGNGSGGLNFGVRLESRGQCQSSGTGAITVTGTSGIGKNNNHGVILSGGTIQIQDGDLILSGQGGGTQNYNYGIRFEAGGQCFSLGTGQITLNGQNTQGRNGNAGICISSQDIVSSSETGNIQMTGTSQGTGILNQGIRIEAGQILSSGTGPSAAQIYLTGTSGAGTDNCNGVAVVGDASEITSIDGNITIEGTAQGTGQGNEPILIDPPTQVYTTGTGTITYISH